MKVILIKDVPNLGKHGDVTNVAEGYARNFLFPRKMAIEGSKGNLETIERQHKVEERLREKRVSAAQDASSKIDGGTVTISAKAGTGTKLFGSITAQDIANAVKSQLGVDVDKRKIDLPKPIRTTGDTQVAVHLHREVVSKLTVVVAAQDQP